MTDASLSAVPNPPDESRAATPAPQLRMITLDCADPAVEATFWSELLGWTVAHVQTEYAMLTGPDGAPAMGFGQVVGHRAPGWPNEAGTKQFHFDLACADLDATEQRCLALGATVADPQPGQTWRVLLDPAGHPFCLTSAANWG